MKDFTWWQQPNRQFLKSIFIPLFIMSLETSRTKSVDGGRWQSDSGDKDKCRFSFHCLSDQPLMVDWAPYQWELRSWARLMCKTWNWASEIYQSRNPTWRYIYSNSNSKGLYWYKKFENNKYSFSYYLSISLSL